MRIGVERPRGAGRIAEAIGAHHEIHHGGIAKGVDGRVGSEEGEYANVHGGSGIDGGSE